MKNFRVEDDKLLFDCEAEDCDHKDEPHGVDLSELIATLQITCEEMSALGDPRSAVMSVVYNLVCDSLGIDEEEQESQAVLEEITAMVDAITKARSELAEDLENVVSSAYSAYAKSSLLAN